MSAPLYERLKAYAAQNRISFAMPGHKNGHGLNKEILAFDVTELDATEDLHHGGEYVTKSQKMLSDLYDSDKSYIITGGSTSAIQAMICGSVKHDGTLLASSDCHMSVINTCALIGIKIRFFPKEIDKEFNVSSRTNSIAEYLTDDIDAVILTSPNYYGICSDIKAIAEECHEKNIPLLVDEAHGAHFVTDTRLPETAVHYADAVCQSAHKTLNAMNGAAYLHVNYGLVDADRMEKSLYMFLSSSPSYVIAASADRARDEIQHGNEWNRTYNNCKTLRKYIAELNIKVLENDDMTRLVLNFSDYDVTGFKVSEILSKNGIDIEMADLFNIVLIITPSNTMSEMNKLYAVLSAIMPKLKKRTEKISIPMSMVCEETLSPKNSFYAKKTEVELSNAVGRVSCSTIVPYPPGVPAVYTGERIKKEHIDYIECLQSAGAFINGLTDGKITVEQEV